MRNPELQHSISRDSKITHISGKPVQRRRPLKLLTLAFSVWLSAFALGQDKAFSEYNVPSEITRCMKALVSGYAISGTINPFYLRGDFDGDRKPDYAVLVRKDDQQGVLVCRSPMAKAVLLGAGIDFHKMKDLNFDAWQVHPRFRQVQRGVEESKPPVLLGDAILLEWEESASAIVYWNGKRFVWYQQGD